MKDVTINKRWTLTLPDHRDLGPWWDTWERERLASMSDIIGPDDVLYYVGAEQGDMPALCATWGADTVLIEPSPQVWPNMRATYLANDCPEPLATFRGFAGAHDWFATGDAVSSGWCAEAYGDVTDVEGFCNLWERPDLSVITLNTLATMVAPPTAISIDVEGSELSVLQGAAAVVLTEHRPIIWVSIHPDFMVDLYGHHPNQVHSLLESHGYVGELLADVHEQHWVFRPR